ncbi:MAG TPA: hypothetical protein VFU49_18515 [Ktedonobacteraceae bacterium]|nr:hypothetical protein [Ktedonobacteraceae bacterium]
MEPRLPSVGGLFVHMVKMAERARWGLERGIAIENERVLGVKMARGARQGLEHHRHQAKDDGQQQRQKDEMSP